MKFISINYSALPSTDWKAEETMKEHAYLFTTLCNKCEGVDRCTVGYLPCPFLLDNMPYALDKMCDNIKPEDWLRHLEVV